MLLREFDHPNIIAIRDIKIDISNRSLSMVMDYAEYDLNELIKYHSKHVRKDKE
jgi:cyclin-dependent kinase 8/11